MTLVDVREQDRSRVPRGTFACPRCHRIVDELLEVRYAIGLVDYPPTTMCESTCLAELHAIAGEYEAGHEIDPSRFVWAIEIVRTIATRHERPRPHAPRSTKPKKKRAAGAVEL